MSLTISAHGGLLGSQVPRLVSVPPFEFSAGGDAVEYAASVGLVMDPWQALVLEGGLGERGRESWAAFEVGVTVTRQNGKGGILEARELAGIELFGERLIMHTAHELKTAEEARLRMEQICEASPDLDRQLKRVVRTNGKEAIEFKNGARIKYVARSERSGRGFTGDVIVMDEDIFLSSESMAALIPTLATAKNPQVWYTGSAGMAVSTHKRALRDRALAGNDPSLAYFEWSVPDDTDLDDRAGWALANPALGIRITERFIANERATLADEDFARERLGIWASEGGDAVISEESWSRLADPESTLSEPVALAIDVNPERTVASVSAASRTADGRTHVEVIDNRSGVAWVVERVANLCRDRKVSLVVVDQSSAVGSLIPALEAHKVPVVKIAQREYGQACGAFYDAVQAGAIRHRGQLTVASAVDAGRKRPVGDAWGWHRRNSKADITPLVAVTLATFGLLRAELTAPAPVFVPRRIR